MSALLRPEPVSEHPCPHADVIWHPLKIVRGAPDGSSPEGAHVAQGGICRRCRIPMLRTTERLRFGPAEPVAGRDPIPRRRHDRTGRGS